MDTPFPLLCKPHVAGIVIFNNFAALHFIFYTKEFTFATYFTKKDSFFLCQIIFRGHFWAKKVPFCVVLSPILPAKCDAFLKIRVKSRPHSVVIFATSSAVSSRHWPGARRLVQRKAADGIPVQAVDACAVHAEHPLDLVVDALLAAPPAPSRPSAVEGGHLCRGEGRAVGQGNARGKALRASPRSAGCPCVTV